MNKTPLFIRFLNRETSVYEMLKSFSQSRDSYTSNTAIEAIDNPPDLEDFRIELDDAVSDIIKNGLGEEFPAFVDHYMSSSLEEDISNIKGKLGENVSRIARVIDKSEPWIQGFVCYNLSLYIRAFGLSSLKKCKVCGRFFCHKGKYAVYCSDVCKSNKNKK